MKLHQFMIVILHQRACVRAGVRARVRVCMCVRVCVSLASDSSETVNKVTDLFYLDLVPNGAVAILIQNPRL